MENHISKNHLKDPLLPSVSGNVSDALRVRIVVEGLFPADLLNS